MTLPVILAIGAVGVGMILIAVVLDRRARRARIGRPIDREVLRVDVLAAIDRNDFVEGVRIYRRATGAGLVEAKEAVEGLALNRR
ncbi:hypothetical protein [Cryptosporangium sp. NPDC051539]|uniref:hypothetical protein n=1 Tax=Cryptosporangium sp. NPDC051539 TaxID=3363962 RepID=UPI0037AB657E